MLLQGPPPPGANITYQIEHMNNQIHKSGLAIHGDITNNLGTKAVKAAGTGVVNNAGTLVGAGLSGYGGLAAIKARRGN
jgi:hypothetical protein